MSSTAKQLLKRTPEVEQRALGFGFPKWKKWSILTTIFLVQISMNFNAAIYATAVPGMQHEFGISTPVAKVGQCIFLVMYAFGCELWAPFSEEFGRKPVLQISLLLVNLCQIPCALATNFSTVLAFRFLGGLSSAGGSVTLGMVADMWGPDEHHYALNFVVAASVGGSVVAPIFGGLIGQYLEWTWVFWIALILGAVTQAIHMCVPETRTDVLMDKEARRMRRSGEDVWGPNEIRGTVWQRLNFRHCLQLIWRPYKMLLTEPIVGFLSLLSGFSDALIFTGLDSFSMVLDKWDFTLVQKGLSFSPLLISYLLTWGSFQLVYRRDRALVKSGATFTPEHRLWWLCYLVPFSFVGLFGFAWCSLGPPHVHWIAPLLFTGCIGIANYAIYMATIDYSTASYGDFAASATGGNGFCRDFLAGLAALYTTPFYSNIATGTKFQLVIPTLILSAVAVLLSIPVYVFYVKGEYFRKRSKVAMELERERADVREAEEPQAFMAEAHKSVLVEEKAETVERV